MCHVQKIAFIQSYFSLAGKPCNEGTLDTTKSLYVILLIYTSSLLLLQFDSLTILSNGKDEVLEGRSRNLT